MEKEKVKMFDGLKQFFCTYACGCFPMDRDTFEVLKEGKYK